MGLFSKKTTIPATGFYALPQEYQDLYTGLLGQAGDILLPDGSVNTEMFTPLARTADEERAFEMVRQGLAPTEESLRADISMLTNPYDDYVIDAINRESQGANSILNQALANTGQMGSNRSILGASDVESQRLGQIGQFRQGQYNTAVNTALGQLANLRGQDISNLFGLGEFERGLDTATKQAPLTALTAGQQALGGFKTEFGNFGRPEQTVKTGGGLGGALGAIGGAVGNYFAPGIGGAIGGAIGGGFGGGNGFDLGGAISGGMSGYGGNPFSTLGLSGGFDPTTGVNWNSGRSGGGFFGGLF